MLLVHYRKHYYHLILNFVFFLICTWYIKLHVNFINSINVTVSVLVWIRLRTHILIFCCVLSAALTARAANETMLIRNNFRRYVISVRLSFIPTSVYFHDVVGYLVSCLSLNPNRNVWF